MTEVILIIICLVIGVGCFIYEWYKEKKLAKEFNLIDALKDKQKHQVNTSKPSDKK
jgi:hypothetical protein